MSDRISQLLDQYRDIKSSAYYNNLSVVENAAPSLPMVSAQESIPLRRAAILNDIMARMPIVIAPHELIVGQLMPGGLNHSSYTEHLSAKELTTLVLMAPVNHIIADYPKLLRVGMRDIQQEARARLAIETASEKQVFLQAVIQACESGLVLGQRYAEEALSLAAREMDPHLRQELLPIADICARVPAEPARTF